MERSWFTMIKSFSDGLARYDVPHEETVEWDRTLVDDPFPVSITLVMPGFEVRQDYGCRYLDVTAFRRGLMGTRRWRVRDIKGVTRALEMVRAAHDGGDAA